MTVAPNATGETDNFDYRRVGLEYFENCWDFSAAEPARYSLTAINGRYLFADCFVIFVRHFSVIESYYVSRAGERRTNRDAVCVYRCVVYNCRRVIRIFLRFVEYLIGLSSASRLWTYVFLNALYSREYQWVLSYAVNQSGAKCWIEMPGWAQDCLTSCIIRCVE